MSDDIADLSRVNALIMAFLDTACDNGANLVEVAQAAKAVHIAAAKSISDGMMELLEQRTAEDESAVE